MEQTLITRVEIGMVVTSAVALLLLQRANLKELGIDLLKWIFLASSFLLLEKNLKGRALKSLERMDD